VAGGDSRPTRKGLTLRPETWGELLPHIAAEVAEIRDRGPKVARREVPGRGRVNTSACNAL